jgi:chromosome segregation ATPase
MPGGMQVRAGSLQELVYKQGQAGVSKASVSIVFSNADKPNSPVGYEQHDQITVTRQVRCSTVAQDPVACNGGWQHSNGARN